MVDAQARAKSLRFDENSLPILLSDGCEISLPLDRVDWLSWLAKATPQQREHGPSSPVGMQSTGRVCTTGSRSRTYSVCSRWSDYIFLLLRSLLYFFGFLFRC